MKSLFFSRRIYFSCTAGVLAKTSLSSCPSLRKHRSRDMHSAESVQCRKINELQWIKCSAALLSCYLFSKRNSQTNFPSGENLSASNRLPVVMVHAQEKSLKRGSNHAWHVCQTLILAILDMQDMWSSLLPLRGYGPDIQRRHLLNKSIPKGNLLVIAKSHV